MASYCTRTRTSCCTQAAALVPSLPSRLLVRLLVHDVQHVLPRPRVPACFICFVVNGFIATHTVPPGGRPALSCLYSVPILDETSLYVCTTALCGTRRVSGTGNFEHAQCISEQKFPPSKSGKTEIWRVPNLLQLIC